MTVRRLALLSGSALTVALLAIALLLPGAASARQDPSPTPAPLGDFFIPTSTPLPDEPVEEVEPAQPTPTTASGGLIIPTSTPSAPSGPALPALSAEDLNALNILPADVPAEFAANQVVQSFDTADLVTELENVGLPDLAVQTRRLAETYGWTTSQAVAYTYCQPNLPVTEIRSEVAPLNSPDAARAFIEDAEAQTLFQAFGYERDFAENVHGWRMTLAQEGVCFAQEVEYGLMFEYWGLVITVAITADANTDPGLPWSLVDQIVPILVARVDALVEPPFPPTPTPGGALAVATAEAIPVEPTEAVVIEPTQEAITPVPTEPVATEPPAPTEISFLPSPTPFTFGPAATPAPLDPADTLAALESLMPTLQEIGLPSPPFSENEALSGIFTFDEVVALAEDTGVPALADAIEAAGSRDGLLGQVMRVWDTGGECPATPALSLEVDLILFETDAGAGANLTDVATQTAWLDTGVFQSFEQQPDGSVLGVGSIPHPCGQLSIYTRSTQVGRVIVSVSAMATQDAPEADILAALDVLTQYMAGKLGELDLG